MSETLSKSQELSLQEFRKHFGSNAITPGQFRIIQGLAELERDVSAAISGMTGSVEPRIHAPGGGDTVAPGETVTSSGYFDDGQWYHNDVATGEFMGSFDVPEEWEEGDELRRGDSNVLTVGIIVTPGPNYLTLAWEHNDDPEGAPRTAYRIRWAPSGDALGSLAEIGPEETEHTISGLPSVPGGAAYDWSVSSVGAGGESALITGTSWTIPEAAPESLVATPTGYKTAELTWDSVAIGDPAGGYIVQVSPDGSTDWETLGTSAAPAFSVTGRQQAETWHYRVAAYNGADEANRSIGPFSEGVVAVQPAWPANYIFLEDFEEALEAPYTAGASAENEGMGYIEVKAPSPATLVPAFSLTDFYDVFPPGGVFWECYVQFRLTGLPDITGMFIAIKGVDDLDKNRVRISSTPAIHATNGADVGSSGSFAIAANTWVHLWFSRRDTGQLDCHASLDGVKPGAVTFSCTSVTSIRTRSIDFGASRNARLEYRKLRISTAPLGSNPT